ncbi:MAG: SLBB domain-containing protein, partial [Gammaproteobacteria bacterium]|nr:SLBB domain-containing protein [Gammaproteobacteria bacterium]
MKLKEPLIALLATLFVNVGVNAVQPTPAQLEAFKKLPPEQQMMLYQQYGGDLLTGRQGRDNSFKEVEVIKPRQEDNSRDRRFSPNNYNSEGELNAGETPPDRSWLTDLEKLSKASPRERVLNWDELPRFGYELFAGEPTTFAPVTDIPVPAQYMVGPGDTIQLRLYGQKYESYDLVVSRRGEVNITDVGSLVVAGLSYEEMKRELTAQIKRKMVGVEVNIAMGELRSMRIFVLGSAYKPGSYTVSALATISSALYVSGGISDQGSLRSIQLKRNGEVITTFDLYDLLINGDTSSDMVLQPGDVIFIPPVGKLVGVTGEVVTPAIYELLPDEQLFSTLMEFCGGLLPTAALSEINLLRVVKSGAREVVNLDTPQKRQSQPLQAGDLVRVMPVLDNVVNQVKLSGYVNRERALAWFAGMRVSDLLSLSQSLKVGTDLDYAIIRRENRGESRVEALDVNLGELIQNPASSANLALQAGDELILFNSGTGRIEALAPLINELRRQSRYGTPPKVVSVSGSVRNPGSYPLTSGMRLSDLMRASYGLLPATERRYALVERLQGMGEQISVHAF